ncbi:MAG: response regulator [Sphingobium sp.]
MRKILIVEDNLMIADMVEEVLLAADYDVCGIATTVAQGMALWKEHCPDLVVVDLRLAHGDLGTELAAKLAPFGEMGILYVTGNSCQVDLSSIDGHGCLSKPYVSADLLRCIQIVIDLAHGIAAKPPYPRGFHVLGAPALSSAAISS